MRLDTLEQLYSDLFKRNHKCKTIRSSLIKLLTNRKKQYLHIEYPTNIGTQHTIKCTVCKEEWDITNYSTW